MLNMSVAQSAFPDIIKFVEISPLIFKKENYLMKENYRVKVNGTQSDWLKVLKVQSLVHYSLIFISISVFFFKSEICNYLYENISEVSAESIEKI